MFSGFAGGMLFLLFAFAGLWWYPQQQAIWNSLPVIQEFTQAYQQGLQELKSVGSSVIGDFYDLPPSQRPDLELSGAATATSETSRQPLVIRSTWHSDNLRKKLARSGFSKGKLRAAGRILDYIEKHKVIALSDMKECNILASIKLAQAILESNAGRSELAKATNNHFGIKALAGKTARRKIREGRYAALRNHEFVFKSPAVDAYNFHDDHRYDRFEVYPTVGASFERHNQLLRRECTIGKKGCYSWIWKMFKVGEKCDITPVARRYEAVSGIAPTEFFNGATTVPYYAAAAAGLKMAGYATSPTYHKKLAFLIETYELWRFDLDLIRAVQEHR